jgi:predicted HicB family RNase H-like nuclease
LIIVAYLYYVTQKYKNMKDKHLSIRISSELHKKYINKAIKKSVEMNRIVKVSEIIREALEKDLDE